MGLDLALLPFDCDIKELSYSHTVLTCHASRELLELIGELPSLETPEGFYCYLSRTPDGEYTCYGKVTEDYYGKRLRYTTVAELTSLSSHIDVRDIHKNRAIWAYLAALPRNTKVALYWD